MPNAPRAFRTPLVPLVPILGVGTCLFMMVFLPLDTWIRLIVWMLIGFDVYLWYSIRKSILSAHLPDTPAQGNKVVGACGLILAAILAGVAFLHHYEAGGDDTGLFYFSLIFAGIHVLLFASRLVKK